MVQRYKSEHNHRMAFHILIEFYNVPISCNQTQQKMSPLYKISNQTNGQFDDI